VVGETAFLSGASRVVTTVAESDCLVLVLSRIGFQKSMLACPEVAVKLLWNLSQQLSKRFVRQSAVLKRQVAELSAVVQEQETTGFASPGLAKVASQFGETAAAARGSQRESGTQLQSSPQQPQQEPAAFLGQQQQQQVMWLSVQQAGFSHIKKAAQAAPAKLVDVEVMLTSRARHQDEIERDGVRQIRDGAASSRVGREARHAERRSRRRLAKEAAGAGGGSGGVTSRAPAAKGAGKAIKAGQGSSGSASGGSPAAAKVPGGASTARPTKQGRDGFRVPGGQSKDTRPNKARGGGGVMAHTINDAMLLSLDSAKADNPALARHLLSLRPSMVAAIDSAVLASLSGVDMSKTADVMSRRPSIVAAIDDVICQQSLYASPSQSDTELSRVSMVSAIDDAVQRSLWDRSNTMDRLWPVAGPDTVAVPASGELWPETPQVSSRSMVPVPESGELWPPTPRETPRDNGSKSTD
jgi:hypothetical protein